MLFLSLGLNPVCLAVVKSVSITVTPEICPICPLCVHLSWSSAFTMLFPVLGLPIDRHPLTSSSPPISAPWLSPLQAGLFPCGNSLHFMGPIFSYPTLIMASGVHTIILSVSELPISPWGDFSIIWNETSLVKPVDYLRVSLTTESKDIGCPVGRADLIL